MFTSRAEYRLLLRADNADLRLTQKGIDVGVVGSGRAAVFTEKRGALDAARARMQGLTATPKELAAAGLHVNQDGVRRSALDLFSYQTVTWQTLHGLWPELAAIPATVAEQLEIEGRYAGYLNRQTTDIVAYRKDEGLVLPDDLDYATVGSLSAEIRLKLSKARPATLGAAARIPGMTPAALTALLGHVKKMKKSAA